ncbi:MAG TPA: glycoside hydrolase family 6 protein [Micromonosporaceae bacterium]|nr:glycoside hydrolase family 6 protein [Micromonosporaceae bacterium]
MPTLRRATVTGLVAALALLGLSTPGSATTTDRSLPPSTTFYVDLNSKAVQQAAADLRAHDLSGAVLMAKLASWPGATWLTGGTPADVASRVADVERRAARQHQVPVLVAYNIPGRDCSQYSAGGAQGTADYAAWIEGFASAIGTHKTVVILEPDGVALAPDQCGGTADQQADRNTQLNAAVTRLEQQPKAIVYLDSGHSAWHAVGDIAQRLITAGVANAQGFFLNVSNYRTDADLVRYGNEVSGCIWYLQHTAGASGDDCANQYWPPADADAWYASHVPADAVLTHFVVDASRNGQGPWTPPAGVYPDPQDWCNPPLRGVGTRPTAATGSALLDAYLWVKVAGESDGSCTRGTAGPGDPEYGGSVDPAAGVWWPAQATSLSQLAAPRLTFNPHVVG